MQIRVKIQLETCDKGQSGLVLGILWHSINGSLWIRELVKRQYFRGINCQWLGGISPALSGLIYLAALYETISFVRVILVLHANTLLLLLLLLLVPLMTCLRQRWPVVVLLSWVDNLWHILKLLRRESFIYLLQYWQKHLLPCLLLAIPFAYYICWDCNLPPKYLIPLHIIKCLCPLPLRLQFIWQDTILFL